MLDGALVAALEQMRTRMPFPLRGFDTDNGGEFMNETVAYCREHGIPCTRSRPYHKNDQAWVEQKNGSVVRRLVGYRRLEGFAAAEALSRLRQTALAYRSRARMPAASLLHWCRAADVESRRA